MTRDIEVAFQGGPRNGRGVVRVNNGARLPEKISVYGGEYKFLGSANTWDGEYHYQDPRYKFEPEAKR